MANLNYFKDPKTNVWRQPTEAELPEFSKSNPNAYKQYMAATNKPVTTYGTVGNTANTNADITPGSGVAANNYTGTRWGNTGNTNTPSVQTGYSSNILSGTGATNAAGSWDDINMDNFDSSYEAGMNAYKTAPTGTGTDTGGGFGGIADDWLGAKTAGGSKFSNLAAGLGSVYGMYAAHQGIGAAKDALNFQKQQYADQQAQQARANKKQDDFGLALASALPAKRVG